MNSMQVSMNESNASMINTGEEASIDKQVGCAECPRWLVIIDVACEKTVVAVCYCHEIKGLDSFYIMFVIFVIILVQHKYIHSVRCLC